VKSHEAFRAWLAWTALFVSTNIPDDNVEESYGYCLSCNCEIHIKDHSHLPYFSQDQERVNNYHEIVEVDSIGSLIYGVHVPELLFMVNSHFVSNKGYVTRDWLLANTVLRSTSQNEGMR